MKTKTKYETTDGQEFDDLRKAQLHQAIIEVASESNDPDLANWIIGEGLELTRGVLNACKAIDKLEKTKRLIDNESNREDLGDWIAGDGFLSVCELVRAHRMATNPPGPKKKNENTED